MLNGLITICHEVGNDGYRGSYWPKTGVRHISISTFERDGLFNPSQTFGMLRDDKNAVRNRRSKANGMIESLYVAVLHGKRFGRDGYLSGTGYSTRRERLKCDGMIENVFVVVPQGKRYVRDKYPVRPV